MSRSTLFALLFVTLTGAGPGHADALAAATSLADAYRALDAPSPGELFALPPGPLRIGRAEIQAAPGVRARPLVAQGRICGLLLEGELTLTYRVDDAFSAPVARRNFKLAPALVPRAEGQGFVFSLPLSAAALWGPDPALAAASPDLSSGARLPAWLNGLLADKIGGNPAGDHLASELNGEPGYRWAAFHAAGDDYVLDVDPRPALRVESFGRLRRVDRDVRIYGGRLNFEELAAQPIAGTWWDSRPLDLVSTATEVDIVNDRADHATIASKIRIQALRDGIRLLQFDLIHDFTDSDNRARHLELESVTVNGAAAVFVQDEGSLLIELPVALAAKQTADLEFRTSGDVLDRPEGNSYWILRTEAWYPKLADGGGEFSTFRMSVESASPFVPFASGEILQREKTALGERVTTSVTVPAERAVAIAGKYETTSRELDGLRVHVATYAASRPAEAERIAGIVLGIRACFEFWTGVPFPFQDLEIVEVKDWGWGQAPPGVIFITQEAFMTPARAQGDDENSELAAWYSRGVNERIAHEVAHSWFPHVAKVYRSEENWLSESFAEYTSVECLLRSMKDKSQAEYFFNRKLSDWKSESKEIGDGGSLYLTPHLSGEKDSDALAVQYLWYAKGPLVLHALRQELARQDGKEKGEKEFMAWIRAYTQNFKFKMGETRHLVGILNQITGKEWQPWFEKYVYGTEMPKVK